MNYFETTYRHFSRNYNNNKDQLWKITIMLKDHTLNYRFNKFTLKPDRIIFEINDQSIELKKEMVLIYYVPNACTTIEWGKMESFRIELMDSIPITITRSKL